MVRLTRPAYGARVEVRKTDDSRGRLPGEVPSRSRAGAAPRLCGSLSVLGAGTYRTEINVYNAADLAIGPVSFQVVSTGAFATNGGAVTANVAKTITARSAIRVECPDVTNRLGTSNVMGFVRIQPPSTAEIAVTAVWTRTF